eukprot:7818854-Ditylum_brightwellii.AAC.1
MRKAESEGRWLLVCKTVNTPKVIKFIDHTLPNIFKGYIDKEDKMKEYTCPVHSVTSRNKPVGLYADALRKAQI